MLLWPIAAKAPSTIEAIETKHQDLLPVGGNGRKRLHHGADEEGHGRHLGRRGKERR